VIQVLPSTKVSLPHRLAIPSTRPRRGRLPSRSLSIASIRQALDRARQRDELHAALVSMQGQCAADVRDRRLEAALDETARLMAARP